MLPSPRAANPPISAMARPPANRNPGGQPTGILAELRSEKSQFQALCIAHCRCEESSQSRILRRRGGIIRHGQISLPGLLHPPMIGTQGIDLRQAGLNEIGMEPSLGSTGSFSYDPAEEAKQGHAVRRIL